VSITVKKFGMQARNWPENFDKLEPQHGLTYNSASLPMHPLTHCRCDCNRRPQIKESDKDFARSPVRRGPGRPGRDRNSARARRQRIQESEDPKRSGQRVSATLVVSVTGALRLHIRKAMLFCLCRLKRSVSRRRRRQLCGCSFRSRFMTVSTSALQKYLADRATNPFLTEVPHVSVNDCLSFGIHPAEDPDL